MSNYPTTARVADIRIREQIRHTTGRDEESLTGLAESIAALGIIQPLVVAPCAEPASGYTFDLIAGERRILAATLAGLIEVPILVRTGDPRTLTAVQAAENLQRENLSLQEIADGLSALTAMYPKGKDLAKAIGKSPAWVSKHLSLRKIDEHMQHLVSEGYITDLETVLMLDQLAKLIDGKHPNAAGAYKAALSLAMKADLSRTAMRKYLDAGKSTTTKDANPAHGNDDEDGESDGDQSPTPPAEKFAQWELSQEAANYLAETLAGTEPKGAKQREYHAALVAGLHALITATWNA